MMTFAEWYRSLPQLEKPQFTDMNGRRIVYSVNPALWRLSDYVVTSRASEIVYLKPRSSTQ